MLIDRHGIEDGPFIFVVDLTKTSNTSTAIFLNDLLTSEIGVEDGMAKVKVKVYNSVRSKYMTYK